MKDYLLISNGKAGTFTFNVDTLQECIDMAAAQLNNGQACSVFTRHSDLKAGEIQVIKSQIQLDIEAKESKVDLIDTLNNILP